MEQNEKFTKLICKVCGGEIRFDGSVYECLACGAKYEDSKTKSQNDILLVSAFEDLRKGEFEDAIENFSIILSNDDTLCEAYWGKALAKNGIIFVDDLIEGKKVPTCQRISEKSFLNDSDYINAVKNAKGAIKENYELMGKKIEDIRVEWLNKASKEKPYDVFICFKDSDKSANIERTNDSYEAQNLYTHLSNLGYRVFFSRESLRDKIAEQYEPYIYNALKTSRVMIVYGQKPEYFSSTWMKNEWRRYARMVADGDKHSASLITVYENFDPSLLPAPLRNRQCLDGRKKTFYGDLERHIEKIIEETTSNDGSGVEKIEIKAGGVAKKVKQVNVAAVDLKKISQGSEFDLSLSEKKQIKVVEKLLENELYTQAEALIDDVTTKNPNNAEALMFKLFVKYRSPNVSTFIALKAFNDCDYIDKVLSCSTKEFAASVLDIFYALAKNLILSNEKDAINLIDNILPYNYENRNANISRILKVATENLLPDSFERIICGIDPKDVDAHINALYGFATTALKQKQFSLAKMYFVRTLKIDEGNINCLRGIIRTTTLSDIPCEECRYAKEVALKGHFNFTDFENLLKYLSDEDRKKEIVAVLDGLLTEESVTKNMVEVFNHIIRYYPSDICELDEELSSMTMRCIKCGYFDSALYYLRLRLEFDRENPEIFWNIIKAKAKVTLDSDLVKSDIKISDMPEFMNFLAVADENQTQRCLDLVKKQEASFVKKSASKNTYAFGEVQKVWDEKRKTKGSKEKKNDKSKNEPIKFEFYHLVLIIALICVVGYVISFACATATEFSFVNYENSDMSLDAVIAFSVLGCFSLLAVSFVHSKSINKKRKNCFVEKSNPQYAEMREKKLKLIKEQNKVKALCVIGILAIIISISAVAIVSHNFSFSKNVDFMNDNIYYSIEDDGKVSVIGVDKNYVKEFDTSNAVAYKGQLYYVTKINQKAFKNSNVELVRISYLCAEIGKNAFENCDELEYVEIVASAPNFIIKESAFKNCENLLIAKISTNANSNIVIEDKVFCDCENLVSVSLGNGITDIGKKAFKNCTSIFNLVIPTSVERLGGACFEGWTAEQTIRVPYSLDYTLFEQSWLSGSDAIEIKY